MDHRRRANVRRLTFRCRPRSASSDELQAKIEEPQRNRQTYLSVVRYLAAAAWGSCISARGGGMGATKQIFTPPFHKKPERSCRRFRSRTPRCGSVMLEGNPCGGLAAHRGSVPDPAAGTSARGSDDLCEREMPPTVNRRRGSRRQCYLRVETLGAPWSGVCMTQRLNLADATDRTAQPRAGASGGGGSGAGARQPSPRIRMEVFERLFFAVSWTI